MKTTEPPPQGHGYGTVAGKEKTHIVKIEEWNSIALCGAVVRHESIIEDSYGIERNVCTKCISQVKRNAR